MMNISYFLRPKVTVTYLTDDCPVRQALDDMLKSGFTAVPVVSPKGKYIGTITEGDFLRLLLQRSAEDLDKMTVGRWSVACGTARSPSTRAWRIWSTLQRCRTLSP